MLWTSLLEMVQVLSAPRKRWNMFMIIWCDIIVWHEMMWYDTWCGTIYNMIWYMMRCMIWYDMILHMIWFMIWYSYDIICYDINDTVWLLCGVIWYDITCHEWFLREQKSDQLLMNSSCRNLKIVRKISYSWIRLLVGKENLSVLYAVR